MKNVLVILMFLLIFSPKIGGKVDSLSFFCFLIFICSFLINSKLTFKKNILNPTILYLIFGFIMLVYAIFLKSIYGLNDNYQILRFGRLIINTLGIFGLVRIYMFYYKDDYGKKLLYNLWLCIILHSMLIVIMFLVPAVNEFVILQLVQMDEANRTFERRVLGLRIGGLTNTWDAASGIQSLGIFLLPFVFSYKERSIKNRKLIFMTIPLSLAAIFLAGLTGLVNIAFVGSLIFLFYFHKIKKYIGALIVKFFVLMMLGFPILGYVLANSHEEWVKASSIGRTLFMITQNDEFYQKSGRSSTANETVDKIFSGMYFLPEDNTTLFLGKGGSGRSDDYRIKADPGPTLNLHNLGIFFVLMVYSYCFFIVTRAVKSKKKDLFLSMGITAVLLTILLIDAKVMYLLARQSFSIMLIAYYSLFWLKSCPEKNI
jgi:hypothetical protein